MLTIIVTVYNSQYTIECCLLSILNQKLDKINNIELIIVDDCSIDKSVKRALKIIEKYKDNKIFNVKLIKNDE